MPLQDGAQAVGVFQHAGFDDGVTQRFVEFEFFEPEGGFGQVGFVQDDDGADAGGWEFDNWLLMRPEGFARGLKNVEVSYRAGYERMPADIREAVMIIAVQRVNEIEGKGVRSKTLAGETVAFSTFGNSGGMPPSAFAILNEYKRKGV